MEVLNRAEQFNENWFSGIREILDRSFIKVNHKVNAELLLEDIKTKDVDKEKLIAKIKSLSEDEWSPKYFIENLKELDDIIGISDEYLKKKAVQELKENDLKKVKWELMKQMMIDYSKFTKEFYDSLKYSRNPKLSRDKSMLMLSIMDALKKINETSKMLINKYSTTKYNSKSLKSFMDVRIAMEHLMLRIYFILLNINEIQKLGKYRDVLARELIEYTIRQEK